MTIEYLKKRRKKNKTLTTVFGVLTAVTFLVFLTLLRAANDEEVETSDALAYVGVASFFLLVIFGIFVCVWGYELYRDQQRIDLIEKKSIPADSVDDYISLQRDKEDKNRAAIRKAKKEGATYYYDGNGDVQINPLPTKSHTKKGSFLDDTPEDHEIFDDPDIDDIVIMDFLDDDEDNFD